MKIRKHSIVIFVAVVLIILGGFYYLDSRPVYSPTNSNLSSDQIADLIKVESPIADDLILSPVVIFGQARGQWFFEASFPIRLLDASGKQIGQGIATAQDEWMTTEFVDFEAELEFNQPATATGTLILEKDNPSGLSEYDAQVTIPVSFE